MANSGGFKTTTLEIPSAWAGSKSRFGWRLASDSNLTRSGWWVDAISFDTDGEIGFLRLVHEFLDPPDED